MTTQATERLTRYLDGIAAELRGPRRQRQRIVTELREGVEESAARRVAAGSTPDRAVAAAIHEFGSPPDIAGAFDAELAIADVRRILAWLLATGPLVGIWWLILLRPRPWTADLTTLIAAIPVVPVVALVIAVAATTFATTGRLIRRLPEAGPSTALVAASAVAAAVLAADVTMIAIAWLRVGAGPLSLMAVGASLIRIGGSAAVLRRTMAWRHRLTGARPASGRVHRAS